MVGNKKAKKGEKKVLKKEFRGSSPRVIHTIDLTQIGEDGSFTCPKCGTVISPDDETEEIYKIVETKVVNDELLELVISCGTCRTILRVTGFQQTVGLAGE